MTRKVMANIGCPQQFQVVGLWDLPKLGLFMFRRDRHSALPP
ncbi:hypothetical protein QM565_11125 [Geitlerinema splendidum]|nr:hypothetical protein [Geitlerinema splendidum]